MEKKDTKIFKYACDGNIYIIRAPKGIGIDPSDVIAKGYIIAAKISAGPYMDAKGIPLGRRATGYNNFDLLPIGVEHLKALASATIRTAKKMDAEEANIGTVLPRLAVMKYHGKTIKLNNDSKDPFYYIDSVAYCANCKEEINGIQKLQIQTNGKVGNIEPFMPTESAVTYKNGSKKWLHERCKTITVPVETVEPVSTETTAPPEPVEQKEPYEIVMEILINQNRFSAEFARGAAYTYLLMHGKD